MGPATSGTTKVLSGVSFADANHGTVVGCLGIIIRTTDGGATWVPESSATNYCLGGVSLTDPGNGTAVGYGGTILRRTEAGPTPTPTVTPSPRDTPTRGLARLRRPARLRPVCCGQLRRDDWQRPHVLNVGRSQSKSSTQSGAAMCPECGVLVRRTVEEEFNNLMNQNH